MTEKSKASLKVAKGQENAQDASTTEATTQEVIPTIEDLKKENEELKRKLSIIPEDLESKINYFNQKKDLIRKLAAMQENKEKLLKHLDTIAQLAAVNDFTNDRYSVTVNFKESYKENEVFRIENTLIIGDVLTFILDRMEIKENQLKGDIEA